MRTAEEILKSLMSDKTMKGSRSIPIITIDECVNFINAARKEAIEECINLTIENDGNCRLIRESIENLIKELK